MYITGDGITTFLVKVKPDYKVESKIALRWVQTSDGNYSAVDRGFNADTFESTVTLIGKQDYIEQFINAVEANRNYDTFHFTLSGFEENENIFGHGIDHSSPLDVTVLKISDVQQKEWKVWQITCTLRLLSPSLESVTAIFPVLKHIDTNIKKVLDYSVNKYDTYYGNYTYLDREADAGVIEINFFLCNNEVKQLKRLYYNDVRGGTYTVTADKVPGVSYPFGSTRPTWPINVKILELNDDAPFGLLHRKISLKLAEVI